jgi:hypothetical protein
MPSELLTKQNDPNSPTPPPAVAPENDGLRAATRQHVKRVRRLKINVAAWVLGTILLTTLWVLNQWQDNGALKSFGHEGEAGQWNPTLWALAIGIWGLIVGIMALQVHFEQPGEGPIGRLKFHAAAWVLGMLVLTPLWALIEWQDNGGFERFSSNSQPGNWEPWILYIGGIWAAVIAVFAMHAYITRPTAGRETHREAERPRSSTQHDR